MNDVIRIELRRALKPRVFAVIMAAVLIYSVYTGISSLSDYHISDANGVIKITAKENLEESKQHSVVLDQQALKEVVDRKDTSLALYNSSLVLMVARNYDKKVTDLTGQDLRKFYQNRTERLVETAETQNEEKHLPPLSKEKIQYLTKQGQRMERPLRLGYKEGWKSLNSNMGQIGILALVLSSFLTLPIFAQSPKTRMKELCMSTQRGKLPHYKARIAAGLLTALLIYIPSMLIFAVTRLAILGPQGGTLPIQSGVTCFFSACNITYFQQFLINFVLGLLAVLLMTALVLLCGAALEQIVSAGAVVAFFWIFMLTPQSAALVHYLYSFLPYNRMDFLSLYVDNDTYSMFGTVLPAHVWTGILIGFFLLCLLAALFLTARAKVPGRIKG